jgi:hypothetical protein
MNDELKAFSLPFRVHRSAFIVVVLPRPLPQVVLTSYLWEVRFRCLPLKETTGAVRHSTLLTPVASLSIPFKRVTCE